MKPFDRSLPQERPAAFFFLALATGLVIGDRFPGNLPLLLLGTLVVCAASRFWGSGNRQALVLTAGVFLVLGYVSLQPWVSPELPPDHIKFFMDGPPGTVTGRVVGLPEQRGIRTRFVFETETFNAGQTCGYIRLTVVGRGSEIGTGDRLQFKARVKSIRNFNNPGAFDYRRYLLFQKVWASAWVPVDRLRVLEKERDFKFKTKLGQLRATLSGWITGTLQKREGRIIAALVTGDRSGIVPQLRQQFNRLGIGHLLAISGLHIGIIATVSFGCFNWLCRRVACLVNTGRSRRAAAFLTIFPVVAYGLVAGLSPSTQRAVIMVTAFLLAIILDRQSDSLNTLAAAALIIIVAHPPSFFSVSFQLSFTAVFAIIYGLACLPEKWRKPVDPSDEKRLTARLIGVFTTFGWVSFFAIAGTLPLAMHYFNQVSYIGLLSNFIYIPLVGFITVPLGLAAALLLPVSGLLAEWFLKAAGFILARAMQLADYLNGLDWISGHTVTLNWFEVFSVLSLMIIALQLIKPRVETSANTGLTKSGRTRRIVWIGLAAVCMLLAGDVIYWLSHRFWHRDLRVTCIDVRQGSAALLEFPGGETMLIDGGGYTDNAIFDIGARVVAPFLWSRKILTVDTLVLTHPNSDHLNGLLYIAKTFKVGALWTNGESADTAGYGGLMQIIRERNIKNPVYSSLPKTVAIGGGTVSRLYPPDDFLSRKQAEAWRTTNNNSVVLKVTMDGVGFLFAGDLMQRAENELTRIAGDRLKATVLFVPHHGSNSSSSQVFLNTVEPALAIISVGRGNRYGFPPKVVLKRYRAVGSGVYRTDRQGAITLSTRGGRLEVETTVRDGF
ncbi:MAG: DNA internalization-related competence protein ComEC/Rec2 [Desulfobacterales bacterium]|nr:DNA internalization-related competence protein ComEC/Rec2 [Desulfobacterales bacterium]